MNIKNTNIKTKCGQQAGKALSNHESFSPSQSHEIVPLTREQLNKFLYINLNKITKSNLFALQLKN
jgi:hypothetical protein